MQLECGIFGLVVSCEDNETCLIVSIIIDHSLSYSVFLEFTECNPSYMAVLEVICGAISRSSTSSCPEQEILTPTSSERRCDTVRRKCGL